MRFILKLFSTVVIFVGFALVRFSKIRFGRDSFRPRSVALHSSEPSVASEKVKLCKLMVKMGRDGGSKKKKEISSLRHFV